MDRTETERLVSIVQAFYGNFKYDDSTVFHWQEYLKDIPYDDAVQFIHKHSESSQFYPTPGEIKKGVVGTNPQGAMYKPAETAYRGDPDLLKRFPKLADYDNYTRALLEASIRHRDGQRSGRVFKNPGPPADPGKNETREVLAERERRIEQCHWEASKGLDTSIEADALIYMQRVKDWFGFSTGNVPLPKGTTFRKDQPRKALPLPAPNDPQTTS